MSEQTIYKFEKFIQPQFPIYTSVQSGREILIKPHYHSAGEILLVQNGTIRLLTGTAYHTFSKGDIIFLPPSVIHEASSLTPDAAILGIVYEFSLIDLADLHLNFQQLFSRQKRSYYLISSDAPDYEELCSHIDSIRKSYGNFSPGNRLKIVSHLLLIMEILIRSFSLDENSEKYRKLQPVLDYIEEHYQEKIQLSELSRLIPVCNDRLIRLFREVTGQTPIAYITYLRIEAAIKLLSQSELSTAEIAERTGFKSDTYMIRVFKQKLNVTPGKYR